MSTSVLVLGAGELGEAVLSALLLAPSFKLTLLVRPTSFPKYEHLRSQGIALLGGDIASSSVAELANLVRNYNTVVSCTGFAIGPGTQLKIGRAILEAGVRRFIPWQFGVDYDTIGRGSVLELFDEQLDVRDLLRGQENTEWIIISTGIFMSFLFEEFFGVVNLGDETKPTVRALGSWENSVAVTTPEDIGLLTREVLLETPRLRNQVVFVSGDVVSYSNLADLIESMLGKLVMKELWTVAMLKEQLKQSPEDAILKYRVLFAEGKGVAWDLESTFNVKRNIPVTNIEAFIRSHFAA